MGVKEALLTAIQHLKTHLPDAAAQAIFEKAGAIPSNEERLKYLEQFIDTSKIKDLENIFSNAPVTKTVADLQYTDEGKAAGFTEAFEGSNTEARLKAGMTGVDPIGSEGHIQKMAAQIKSGEKTRDEVNAMYATNKRAKQRLSVLLEKEGVPSGKVSIVKTAAGPKAVTQVDPVADLVAPPPSLSGRNQIGPTTRGYPYGAGDALETRSYMAADLAKRNPVIPKGIPGQTINWHGGEEDDAKQAAKIIFGEYEGASQGLPRIPGPTTGTSRPSFLGPNAEADASQVWNKGRDVRRSVSAAGQAAREAEVAGVGAGESLIGSKGLGILAKVKGLGKFLGPIGAAFTAWQLADLLESKTVGLNDAQRIEKFGDVKEGVGRLYGEQQGADEEALNAQLRRTTPNRQSVEAAKMQQENVVDHTLDMLLGAKAEAIGAMSKRYTPGPMEMVAAMKSLSGV